MADRKLRVLVVGLGNMGMSHALAYTRIPDFEVVGVCERRIAKRDLPEALKGAKKFDDFEKAFGGTQARRRFDQHAADTHAQFAIKAMEAGRMSLSRSRWRHDRECPKGSRHGKAHGQEAGRWLYPARPSIVAEVHRDCQAARNAAGLPHEPQPAVHGETWDWHKRLLNSFPPIVDCGVHYVDVMCQMTKAKPIKVHAIGAQLTNEVKQQNYGMLQVIFDDGSVGWYEAGWGPMMSETAFFVKDVVGPKGSVSIVMAETAGDVKSDDINAHTKTNQILWHHADMKTPDQRIDVTDEPGHDDLCEREQRYLLKAIKENIDLTDHMNDAVKSLKIVMAADRSIHEGQVVSLT